MDLFGNRVERRLDQGNNGTIEERTTYSYDENDLLLEEIAFNVVQSVETERTRTTYEWQVTQQAVKTVRSAAGQIQTRQEFGYDLHGRLARAISETRDASDAVTSRQERCQEKVSGLFFRVPRAAAMLQCLDLNAPTLRMRSTMPSIGEMAGRRFFTKTPTTRPLKTFWPKVWHATPARFSRIN